MRKAVFLDRDGVINRERRNYVRSWSEFEFLPGALSALARLNQADVTTVVVTNQSVVGRGLISREQLNLIHEQMRTEIAAAGGRIDAVYACVHPPEAGCRCRKPGTALFSRAAIELNVELRESVMVGDTLTDVEAAQAVGCLPVLVSRAEKGFPVSLVVVEDLAQAVEHIVSRRAEAVTTC